MGALLDAEFLRALEALRRRLVTDARSGGTGDVVGPRRGASAEFREHRPYASGDDPRRIDWMAFARTGEPVVKLYRAEEDSVVRLLLDASGSLAFGEPPKIDTARKLAAALGYLALASSQRAQLFVAREGAGARGALAIGAARRGRRAFPELCRELEGVDAEGPVALVNAIDGVLQRAARPGLLVVISDFFDPGPVPEALRRARAQGNDVMLVQVLDRFELEPELEGDLTLADAETLGELAVTVDAEAREAYERRLFGLFGELAGFAKKHGASYTRFRSGDDLESVVRRILSRAVD